MEVNDNKPHRSTSVKRGRSEDQTQSIAKRAKSSTTSKHSPSPTRDYPRGTCTVTKSSPIKSEDRPVQAQDLANF